MGFMRTMGLVAVAACFAAGGARAEEGTDHPAIARYPGSELRHSDIKEYEEYQLVLSKPYSKGGKITADKLLPLEGKVTYLQYETPKSTSTLQVFRNYQSALRRGGFTELFVCERPCGSEHFSSWKELMKAQRLYLNGGSDELFYEAVQRDNVYVALGVTMVSSSPSVFLFVVEKAALDDQKIAVVGTGPIAQGLARGGRVDVYGFLFDTNKSQLKPESASTLRELAQVLKDNPQLAIDIVGHTDDVGSAETNQALSLGRAQAVALALTKEHAIDVARLSASGRGATQPVAPNKTDEGRAKNRRVEIVARGTAGASTASAAPVAPAAPTAPAAPPAPTPVVATETKSAQPAEGATEKTSKVLDAARKLKDLLGR